MAASGGDVPSWFENLLLMTYVCNVGSLLINKWAVTKAERKHPYLSDRGMGDGGSTRCFRSLQGWCRSAAVNAGTPKIFQFHGALLRSRILQIRCRL